MTELIISQVRFLPQALILTVLLCITYLFVKDNKGHTFDRLKELMKGKLPFVLFVFWAALIFTSTVFARPLTNPYTHIFDFFLYDGWGKFNVVGLLNVLMFVPYTVLYIIAFTPDKPFIKSLQLTIATTILIEVYQLLFWAGQFSLADMTHNIIGGILGYGVWYIIKQVIPKHKNAVMMKKERDKPDENRDKP